MSQEKILKSSRERNRQLEEMSKFMQQKNVRVSFSDLVLGKFFSFYTSEESFNMSNTVVRCKINDDTLASPTFRHSAGLLTFASATALLDLLNKSVDDILANHKRVKYTTSPKIKSAESLQVTVKRTNDSNIPDDYKLFRHLTISLLEENIKNLKDRLSWFDVKDKLDVVKTIHKLEQMKKDIESNKKDLKPLHSIRTNTLVSLTNVR